MQKEYRLRNNRDFRIVYKYGRSIANRQLVLYYLSNKHIDHFRVGISISKKIGHAVVRNRMKRLVKEIIRNERDHLPQGYDYVVIIRKPALDLDYAQLKKSIHHIFNKSKLKSK